MAIKVLIDDETRAGWSTADEQRERGCAMPKSLSHFKLRLGIRNPGLSSLLKTAFVLILFLGLVPVSSVANPPQETTLETLYEQARASEERGDIKTATAKYERIVSMRPDLAEAYANLGRLYYEQHELDQAARALKKAIELKPELAGPYFFLGVVSFNSREYDEALRYLKKAQTLAGSEILPTLYLGYTYYGLHKYLDAVRDFQKVARVQQDDQDVWYYLSMSYGQAAKEYYKSLQQKFPQSFYTHLARGHAYEAQLKWDDAKREYSLALDLQPKNARLGQRLEWASENAAGKAAGPPPSRTQDSQAELIDGSLQFLYGSRGGSDIATELDRYEHLIEKDSGAPSAESIYTLGENCQILSYLTSLRVLVVAPDSYRAHELKAQFYAEVGQKKEAIKEYQAAATLKPDLPEVHFQIGSIYWGMNNLEEALPELERELSIQPNYPEALYEVGDIFYSEGKLKEAEEYFLKALKFEPGMVAAHLGLEQIYTTTGRFSESLTELESVLKLDPSNQTSHYRMAMILRKMGKQAEAQQQLQIFLSLRSNAGTERAGSPAAAQKDKP